jgi:transposase
VFHLKWHTGQDSDSLSRKGKIEPETGGATMNGKGQRRKWTAGDKLRIVLAGMQPNVEVSELCRREGIHPTQYYGWKKQLLSSATKVFDNPDGKRNAAEERKEAEMVRLKNVIAEITAENLDLKKGLSV